MILKVQAYVDNGIVMPLEVEGHESGVPGLAVHLDFDGEDHWHATHISSGLRLPGDFDSMKEARDYCERLRDVADWTQPVEVLERHREKIVEAAYAALQVEAVAG